LVWSASTELFTDDELIVSRKYDNLPWPLLNPHSVDFQTTHGLHCYHSIVEALDKNEPLDWVEELHISHCYGELRGVVNFLSENPNFNIPELLCPKITGNGKIWHNTADFWPVEYYNCTGTYKITLNELLNLDPAYQRVYTKNGKLYSNYQNAGLGSTMLELASVFKSRSALYISKQDIGIRMLAGFNYGLILAKHLLKVPMNEEEKAYIVGQQRTQDEWAWTTASFYCTFGDDAAFTLRELMKKVESKSIPL